jgi:hypothetical protein
MDFYEFEFRQESRRTNFGPTNVNKIEENLPVKEQRDYRFDGPML